MKQAREAWASFKAGLEVTHQPGELLWDVLLPSNDPETPPCSGTFLGATGRKPDFFQESAVRF